MNPRLAKWLRWFDVIKSEIQDLVLAKYTFQEVRGIICANPTLDTPSWFYEYFTRTHVSHVVIGLRRQTKRDDQSISITRLFEEMISTPEVLTRQWFKEKYRGSPREQYADNDFDKFASSGSLYIDSQLVNSDLCKIKTATKRCEDFADKRIAHRDKRYPKNPPTYREIDESVELLDQIYVKYNLLFHQSCMDTLLPTPQYDWKGIFRIPWIGGEI